MTIYAVYVGAMKERVLQRNRGNRRVRNARKRDKLKNNNVRQMIRAGNK